MKDYVKDVIQDLVKYGQGCLADIVEEKSCSVTRERASLITTRSCQHFYWENPPWDCGMHLGQQYAWLYSSASLLWRLLG